jgi:hypothetical protein
MKTLKLTLIFSIFISQLFAQVIKQELYRTSENDVVYDFIQTEDGGHLFTGNIREMYSGGADVFLLKTDETGEVEWGKTYGGESDDVGLIVRPTSSGNYLIAGQTYSFDNGEGALYVILVDESGDLIWSKSLNLGSWTCVYDVSHEFDNGDFIIAGTKNPSIYPGKEIFMTRMDQYGNFIWFKTYNSGIENDWVYDLNLLNNGDLLLSCRLYYTVDMGYAGLIRINPDGDVIWAKTYNNEGFGLLNQTAEDNEGNIYTVGRYDAYGIGNYETLLLKVNGDGNPFWAKIYGGSGFDFGRRIQRAENGNLFLAGTTDTYGFGDRDLFLMNLSNDGDVIWAKAYGGMLTDTHHAMLDFIVQDDQSIIIRGCSKSFSNGTSDIYLIHADSSGMSGCHEMDFEPDVYPFNPAVNNPYITVESYPTGYTPTEVNAIGFEYELLCSDTMTTQVSPFRKELYSLKLTPNPAKNSVIIETGSSANPATYMITSMHGEIVSKGSMSGNNPEVDINQLVPGVYFLEVYDYNNHLIGAEKLVIP